MFLRTLGVFNYVGEVEQLLPAAVTAAIVQRLSNGVVAPTAGGRFVMPVVYVRVSSPPHPLLY
jgi:hypothetical protein